mgnify:CR=1 FL=1
MHQTFIIAEVGVNHNGDLVKANQLIDAAVAVGADAVKFQTAIPELVVTTYLAPVNFEILFSNILVNFPSLGKLAAKTFFINEIVAFSSITGSAKRILFLRFLLFILVNL